MKSVPEILEGLKLLVKKQFNEDVVNTSPLPISGSPRRYFRLTTISKSVIGTYNADIDENIAFFHINESFHKIGVNVPVIYCINREKDMYLQEDLGTEDLYKQVQKTGANNQEVKELYRNVFQALVKIQFESVKVIDFSKCYPRAAFDRQSIQWDLQYFKYMYLKVSQISLQEQKLEDDFQVLTNHLLEAPSEYFMYRDFKSKNIILRNNEVFCIDYQGGRKGALQYDVASLLFEGKQKLSEPERKELLEMYCEAASHYPEFNKSTFLEYYPAFVLIRLLQAFGAYGYRGLIERKSHFIESIPGGLENLQELLDNYQINCEIPHLREVIRRMIGQKEKFSFEKNTDSLTVKITSFSYKKGIPEDYSGNGGGFVFDCRWIENPGRIEEYKSQTGLDDPVIEFLESKKTVRQFINSSLDICQGAVENYISRDFSDLSIAFGCTGGQHRSVFMAEKIASELSKKYTLCVILLHRELNKRKEYGKNNV